MKKDAWKINVLEDVHVEHELLLLDVCHSCYSSRWMSRWDDERIRAIGGAGILFNDTLTSVAVQSGNGYKTVV